MSLNPERMLPPLADPGAPPGPGAGESGRGSAWKGTDREVAVLGLIAESAAGRRPPERDERSYPIARGRPRPRVTVRQLVVTIAALAIVNAIGARLDRPLASGPGAAPREGQRYFADAEAVRYQARVAEHRVVVLRLVTILVGSAVVLTALGFRVFIAYLEAIREHRDAASSACPGPAGDRPQW